MSVDRREDGVVGNQAPRRIHPAEMRTRMNEDEEKDEEKGNDEDNDEKEDENEQGPSTHRLMRMRKGGRGDVRRGGGTRTHRDGW